MTSGRDSKINKFDLDFKLIGSFDFYGVVPDCLDGHIRSIAFNEDKKRMAIGLLCGEIYEMNMKYSSL
jgi:hypothetical protein